MSVNNDLNFSSNVPHTELLYDLGCSTFLVYSPWSLHAFDVWKRTARVTFITFIMWMWTVLKGWAAASVHVIGSGHLYGVMCDPLMKAQQFSRAAGPQWEGLQSQLCPGLLIHSCSLLIVPVGPQIFPTSASKEKKQTRPSDTTHTQTTPAHRRECAWDVRGQRACMASHFCFKHNLRLERNFTQVCKQANGWLWFKNWYLNNWISTVLNFYTKYNNKLKTVMNSCV